MVSILFASIFFKAHNIILASNLIYNSLHVFFFSDTVGFWIRDLEIIQFNCVSLFQSLVCFSCASLMHVVNPEESSSTKNYSFTCFFCVGKRTVHHTLNCIEHSAFSYGHNHRCY